MGAGAPFLVSFSVRLTVSPPLQGGSFDVADRMFHSVKNAWESASRENMSDVRELTPEFFYLPEFLTNCNAVEFGEWAWGGRRGLSPRLGPTVSASLLSGSPDASPDPCGSWRPPLGGSRGREGFLPGAP